MLGSILISILGRDGPLYQAVRDARKLFRALYRRPNGIEMQPLLETTLCVWLFTMGNRTISVFKIRRLR